MEKKQINVGGNALSEQLYREIRRAAAYDGLPMNHWLVMLARLRIREQANAGARPLREEALVNG